MAPVALVAAGASLVLGHRVAGVALECRQHLGRRALAPAPPALAERAPEIAERHGLLGLLDALRDDLERERAASCTMAVTIGVFPPPRATSATKERSIFSASTANRWR